MERDTTRRLQPDRVLGPVLEREPRRELSVAQRRILHSEIARIPASELQSALLLEQDSFGGGWLEDLDPAEESSEAEDDLTDASDLEDPAADDEGDATEHDDDPMPLEALPLETPRRIERRVDVIIDCIRSGDGPPELVVHSGTSDLLLLLDDGDGLARARTEALREKIRDLTALARVIVRQNHDYFAGQTALVETVPSDSLRQQVGGMTEERLSHLLAAASVRRPDGETADLRTFVAEATDEETDRHLLAVLARHSEEDRLDPWNDTRLAEAVSSGRGSKVARNTIAVSRKRLGIPEHRKRRAEYARGLTLIAMVDTSPAAHEMLVKWRRLLEAQRNHRNPEIRRSVRSWLADVNERMRELRSEWV